MVGSEPTPPPQAKGKGRLERFIIIHINKIYRTRTCNLMVKSHMLYLLS